MSCSTSSSRVLRTPGWPYVEWDDQGIELYDTHTDPYQLRSLRDDSDSAFHSGCAGMR